MYVCHPLPQVMEIQQPWHFLLQRRYHGFYLSPWHNKPLNNIALCQGNSRQGSWSWYSFHWKHNTSIFMLWRKYCNLFHPVLEELKDTWILNPSPSSLSVLLEQTNNVLTAAVKATQKVIFLKKEHKEQYTRIHDELSCLSLTQYE